jgi:hypothetical protein
LLAIFVFLLLPIKTPPTEAPKPCGAPISAHDSTAAK